MLTTHDTERRLATLRQQGLGLGEALSILRQEGASLLTSMAAVRNVEQVELGDAKRLVLESSAWSDHQKAHENFVDSLLAELIDEGNGNT